MVTRRATISICSSNKMALVQGAASCLSKNVGRASFKQTRDKRSPLRARTHRLVICSESTTSGNQMLTGNEALCDSVHIPSPPELHGLRPRASWNATALAFLGDSVWELYVRRANFHPPTRNETYYKKVQQQVRAETQEQFYLKLQNGDYLTSEERDILRWGKNGATGSTPKRFSGSENSGLTYKRATALEVLTGYLYLTSPDRLHGLMEHLKIA